MNLRFLRIPFIVTFLITAFSVTGWGYDLERTIQTKINFRARNALGKNPKLDPRIRIVNFDDETFAKLQRFDLPFEDFVSVLRLLLSTKPSSLFIDQVFGLPFPEGSNLPKLSETLAGQKVVVGSFVSGREIAGRFKAPMDRRELQPETYLSKETRSMTRLEWLPTTPGILYGPSETLLPHFPLIGHLAKENDLRVKPAFHLPGNRYVLSAAVLAAAKDIELSNSGIKADGKAIALDARGYIDPNINPHLDYYENSYSMTSILQRARAHATLPEFKEGDVIVVLPAMYTGNTDFKDGPLGRIPGGFIHVSIINSVLTGQWLSSIPFAPAFIAALGIAGIAFSQFVPIVFALWSLLPAALLIVLFGIGLFTYQSLTFPWFFSASAFAVSGLLVLASRTKLKNETETKVRATLQGLVSEDVLDKLYKNPESLNRDPSEKVITVMFVDIAHFSLMTELLTPKQAFDFLRSRVGKMTEIVLSHGGSIDKTLGDGLLCFFGHKHDGSSGQENHALQALACAKEIQRENMEYCASAKSAGEPACPLRIGINSGAAYIGNIGNNQRVDYTIIGHTVNYARRLEEGCESFRIMVGPATHNLVSLNIPKEQLKRRDLNIKHHKELLEGYEYDPFLDQPELVNNARAICRETAKLERKEVRYVVPDGVSVSVVVANSSTGKLVDFSINGFSVDLPNYLANKVQLLLYIGTEGSDFRSKCMQYELMPIECEVRWGRPEGKMFRHGVLVRNLNPHQRDLLVELLREHSQV